MITTILSFLIVLTILIAVTCGLIILWGVIFFSPLIAHGLYMYKKNPNFLKEQE